MSSLDFDEDDEKKLLFVAVESGDGIGLLKNRKKVKKKNIYQMDWVNYLQ